MHSTHSKQADNLVIVGPARGLNWLMHYVSLVVVVVLGVVVIGHQLQIAAAAFPGAEDNLERWVQQEADRHKLEQPAMSCHSLEGGQLDGFTGSFANALLDDGADADRLQVELAHAINIGELSPEAPSEAKGLASDIQPSRGILDVLQSDHQPLVVHSKRLSPEAIEQLREFAQARPNLGERRTLEQFFDTANSLSRTAATEGQTQLLITTEEDRKLPLEKLADSALYLSELLSLTPTFVLTLPVLGSGITQLKHIGQATFIVIKSIHTFQRLLESWNKSPSSGTTGKLRSFISKDPHVKLFGEKGFSHLLRLGHKMADKFVRLPSSSKTNSLVVREIAARTAYYLLISYAMQAPLCD